MTAIKKYAVILNTFDPEFRLQAGRIAKFLEDSGLIGGDGCTAPAGAVVLCSRLADAAVQASEALEGFAILSDAEVYSWVSECCMPGSAAEHVKGVLADADLILLPGNKFGEELAVHLEVKLDGTAVTGALDTEIHIDDTDIPDSEPYCCMKVRKKIYAGHVTGTFELRKKPFILAVDRSLPADAGACIDPEMEDSQGERTEGTANLMAGRTVHILEDAEVCSGPDIRDFSLEAAEASSELDGAKYVAAIGMGAGNKAGAEELRALAEAAGMTAAGSRPCVMNAWMPMNRMLGVSGRVVSPDIAVLLGISGAPAFYEGVKSSGKIISVNSDPGAPVVSKSDLAVIGDCKEIMRLFTEMSCHTEE